MPNISIVAGLVLATSLLTMGWLARGWYDERNMLEDENAAYVAWVKEFKQVSDSYAVQLYKLPTSDTDTGPAVTAAIDGLRKSKPESGSWKTVLRPAGTAEKKGKR